MKRNDSYLRGIVVPIANQPCDMILLNEYSLNGFGTKPTIVTYRSVRENHRDSSNEDS